MAQTVCPLPSTNDLERLATIAVDPNAKQKHALRARIILASVERANVQQVATQTGATRPAVWRWQLRFAEQGVDGLLCDKTRKPGKAPVTAERTAEIVAMTCAEPPGEVTHWTGRAMAKATGLSLRTIQRIWDAHNLQPHRIRTFKRSNDPNFAAKIEDIVGLYMAPPSHAIVLSIDEKSQIQALDRTQPGLSIKPGKCGTMTHDYIRNGTTTLFAALNVLDGTVIGKNMQQHRHKEFINFLNAVDRQIEPGKDVHVILDNYATHKHPKVMAWLKRHPHWTFHFTPTSASWLNAVENFFSILTKRRLKRGVFHSLVDLQAAINRFIKEHNKHAKPFVWTATSVSIFNKVNRANASVH